MKKLLLLISCLCLCTIHYGQQVNIKDFGAKGDGIQDDLAAWDSAISYVLSFPQYQTPEIIVPAGVYWLCNKSCGLLCFCTGEKIFKNNKAQ